jgi:hypothetical protein
MFNPYKSIRSRYSLTTIPNNYYSTISITSGTTNLPLGSGLTAGYVFAPYIIAESTTMSHAQIQEWIRKQKRKERKEKLNKIWF